MDQTQHMKAAGKQICHRCLFFVLCLTTSFHAAVPDCDSNVSAFMFFFLPMAGGKKQKNKNMHQSKHLTVPRQSGKHPALKNIPTYSYNGE